MKLLAQRGGDRIQFGSEARQCRGGAGVVHLPQQHRATDALNQHAAGTLVGAALDEVAFSMACHHPVVDLGRARMHAHDVKDLAAPVIATLV